MCDKWVLLYMNFFSFGKICIFNIKFYVKSFFITCYQNYIKCDYLIIISICFIDIVVIYVYSFE